MTRLHHALFMVLAFVSCIARTSHAQLKCTNTSSDCQSGICTQGGDCKTGVTCSDDKDCAMNSICIGGRCTCHDDNDCGKYNGFNNKCLRGANDAGPKTCQFANERPGCAGGRACTSDIDCLNYGDAAGEDATGGTLSGGRVCVWTIDQPTGYCCLDVLPDLPNDPYLEASCAEHFKNPEDGGALVLVIFVGIAFIIRHRS